MAPHAEGAAEGTGSAFGRGRLLAGALGALAASLVAKVRPAAADDVAPGRSLLLGAENVADTTTGLLQDAGSPAFEVRNPSGPGIVSSALLPREVAISMPFAAGVFGSGERLGVVGSSLPAEAIISIPFESGLAGFGERLGVVGSSLPAQATISIPHGFAAGVAGVGERLGVVGSSLPAQATISMAHGFAAGVAGLGERLGVIGSALLPDQATITYTPVSFRAGVVGSSLPGEVAISIPFDAGVAGFSERLGIIGSAILPEQATITYTPPGFRAGVVGRASGSDAVGVLAQNPDGYALRTIGKVAFSNGGTGVVPRGSSGVTVDDSSISDESLVNVTLMDDTGAAGVALHYARPGNGSLRVVLTGPARRDTPFNYFVFDRA